MNNQFGDGLQQNESSVRSIRFNMYLRPRDIEIIEVMAKQMGDNMSGIVRRALEFYYSAYLGNPVE